MTEIIGTKESAFNELRDIIYNKTAHSYGIMLERTSKFKQRLFDGQVNDVIRKFEDGSRIGVISAKMPTGIIVVFYATIVLGNDTEFVSDETFKITLI